MKSSPARVYALENLYVREFRASQALFALTLDEHAALSREDIEGLPRLTARKDSMLDDLTQLEKAKLGALNDLGIDPLAMPTGPLKLVASLADVDREVVGRLLHMQEGTWVLMERVRDITLVNRALAVSALERANCQQSELLTLYYASLEEDGNGDRVGELVGVAAIESLEATGFGNGQTALPAVFAAIIAARDALNQGDRSVISSAVGDLQSALEGITGVSEIDGRTGRAESMLKKSSMGGCSTIDTVVEHSPTSLVEMIANLYHQVNAYQASLDVSNRTLELALG